MRHMRRALLLASLMAGVAAPLPAGAQPSVTAPPSAEAAPDAAASLPGVTPEKLAAAHELLITMNTQANAVEMFKNLRGVLVQSIQSRTSKPQEEIGKIVDELLMPEITGRMDEFVEALAQVQASVYSLDDLHQLTEFYRTPLGHRVVALMPQLGALSFAAGQEWGKRVAIDALRKHQDELRDRGVKL